MQSIAIASLTISASGSALLLAWLWSMASTQSVPRWLKAEHDSRGGNVDLL
ncbi:MAG: hypothetical protein JNL25_09935 [Rhodospirillaceae bacterium]|nr:hypothetical protein [Rhodospirillaceae bacterium]